MYCSCIGLVCMGTSRLPELISWPFVHLGACTDSTLPRPRLQTTASSEIQLRVVVGSKSFSLLTSPLNHVRSLKEQIEELSGVPADCQLLRLDGKPLVMNNFLLGDYRILDNSTIHVQVHPWNEEYVYQV